MDANSQFVASDFCPPTRSTGPDGLWVHAPAKVNLNLLVAPVRGDGFHPLDSYVAKISFYDRLKLRARSDGKIRLNCTGLDCGPSVDNLASRAAELLRASAGLAGAGADILLEKYIPPGGGLGGGSSDAAAVLAGLNELWNAGLATGDLAGLAAELGSDVPLFLAGAASRMTGRGEVIEPVKIWPFWLVLILPGLVCPTGQVYRQFDAASQSEPLEQLNPALLAEPVSHWRALLVNHLAKPAMQLVPELAEIHDTLAAATGLPVHVSGSGSTLILLCDDQTECRQAMEKIPPEIQPLCQVARLNQW